MKSRSLSSYILNLNCPTYLSFISQLPALFLVIEMLGHDGLNDVCSLQGLDEVSLPARTVPPLPNRVPLTRPTAAYSSLCPLTGASTQAPKWNLPTSLISRAVLCHMSLSWLMRWLSADTDRRKNTRRHRHRHQSTS